MTAGRRRRRDPSRRRRVGDAGRAGLGARRLAARASSCCAAADVVDVSAAFPTMRALTESADPAAAARRLRPLAAPRSAPSTSSSRTRRPRPATPQRPWLLSPIDLHVVKAAGVTFPVSMLERVIEERARGDQDAAAAIRAEILGDDRRIARATLRPGSAEAMAAQGDLLIERGWWSQYLEVGIGPDAEVFTKAPVLATVGTVRRRRRAPRLAVEQPRARGRARRRVRRPHRRRDASATTSTCATSRGAAPCCSARRRTTTRRPRSGRSSACSTTAYDLDALRASVVTLVDRRRGRLSARRRAASSRRSAATPPTSSTRSSAPTTSTPTASCSTSARCSRRSTTATCPAAGSRTTTATSCRSPNRGSARS